MNLPKANSSMPINQTKSPYKLSEEQEKIYVWLKDQGLNVDDDTLNYWVRKYRAQRLVDVVKFAHTRRAAGQQIRNIGGWIHRLLKDDAIVVTDDCQENRKYVEQYASFNQWKSLHIYEKYIKEETTGDDLPLTISKEEFRRALEALHRRTKLYGESG
jgi:hypothetical protein